MMLENGFARHYNRNIFWANIFVDELARLGVNVVSIAPGSRSTPLAIAFAQEPAIKVFPHLDERSASFFALGISLESQKPSVALCTSGTAAANFFPVVVEANQSEVPLILITADRPNESRGSGANQTIDQLKLFGNQVRWFVDVPLPEPLPSPQLVRYLRSLAGRALAEAGGSPPGPVHLNFPFRKPLEPIDVPGDFPAYPDREFLLAASGRTERRPFVRVEKGKQMLSHGAIQHLAEMISQAKRGVIVCGPRSGDSDFAEAVYALSEMVGFPLLADSLSGARFHASEHKPPLISGYDTFLDGSAVDVLASDLIIQFGDSPVSTSLLNWLGNQTDAERVHIASSHRWADEHFHTSHKYITEPTDAVRDILRAVGGKPCKQEPAYTLQWQTAEKITWANLRKIGEPEFIEPLLVQDVLDCIPSGGVVFLGNSLPVRHLDQFCGPAGKTIRTMSNRGASGIDGVVSTAIGAAAGSENPVVLIVGDLSFLHDQPGLVVLQRALVPIVIIVFNNHGGGIFHRLPISKYEPPFTDMFITPQSVGISEISKAYGINYSLIDSRKNIRELLELAFYRQQPMIIEVSTDARLFEIARKNLVSQVSNEINITKSSTT